MQQIFLLNPDQMDKSNFYTRNGFELDNDIILNYIFPNNIKSEEEYYKEIADIWAHQVKKANE